MVSTREWVSGVRRALTDPTEYSDYDHDTEDTDEDMTPEVLSTGHTEAEFERELDRREDVLKELENSIVRHGKKYRQFLEKATEKRGDRKIRFLMKAKKQEIKHEIKNEIYDDLMRQQLFLVKLLLHDKKQKMRAAGETWDFEINVADLPVEDMIEDIESESERMLAVQEVIEEMEMSMGASSEDALGIDLSDIEKEAAELEAADIADKSLEVDSELESNIDDRIQDELADIDGIESETETATDD